MDYFVMIVVLIFDYFGSSQSADKVSLFYLWYIVLSLTAKCTEIRNLRSCNLSILNNSKIREDLVYRTAFVQFNNWQVFQSGFLV